MPKTTKTTTHRPQPGERIAILWLASDGVTDGETTDLCTVVAANEYTMTVRVGWQGRDPLLMIFRALVCEETNLSGLGGVASAPMVRESAGIPANFQD